MNILFLTIGDFDDFEAGSVHIDIVKKIAREGHDVYVACKNEDPNARPFSLEEKDGIKLLHIRIGAVKKNTNIIKKGISTIRLERKYIKAMRYYFNNVKFDLIIYHTPPVTFEKVVKYIKKRDGANSYLLLKDIFPQNAVDLGMMKTTGIKGLIYKYFRYKEINLYKVSDYIGCMSPANVEYLLKHNTYIDSSKVEVAPNSIDLFGKNSILDSNQVAAERLYIRKKYNLPLNKPIFVYGGNLGKPQGIDYLIRCMQDNKDRKDCFFLIVGGGSEFSKLADWYDKSTPQSVGIHYSLPKDEYEILVRSCDVGMIFLDSNFTIPNYPSRLLSYLQNKIPVVCATDINTDIGLIAEENGYGLWCESVKSEDFTALVDKMLKSDIKSMGYRGYEYLCNNYLVEHTYDAIFNHFMEHHS